jgi:hypothetical protein
MDGTEIQTWGLVIAIISVITAIVFNIINRHYQKRQLRINTLFHVFELLSSTEIRNARKTVYDEYHKLKNENKPLIFNRSAFIQQEADKAKSSFDRVAVLLHEGLLDDKLFFRMYGGIVVRFWNATEEDILNDRKKNPVYCDNFKKLKEKYEKCFTTDTMPKPYQRELEKEK